MADFANQGGHVLRHKSEKKSFRDRDRETETERETERQRVHYICNKSDRETESALYLK